MGPHHPSVGGARHTDATTNPLLDLLGPIAICPLILALFWESSTPGRLALGFTLQLATGLVFGISIPLWARADQRRYDFGEAMWSCCSAAIAGLLPWIIDPNTMTGIYASALLFSATIAIDALYNSLRPNRVWKFIHLASTASAATYLAINDVAVLAIMVAVFGGVLVGAHDEIQGLVHRLRREQAETQRLAETDALTGLSNRRRLNRYFDLAESNDHDVIIAFLDVDNFKGINDRHGHSGGDHVLNCLARHLTASLGPKWLCVRSGGDEFVCASTQGTIEEARRSLNQVPAVAFDGSRIAVSVSAGLLRGAPGPDLLATASAALRRAKQRGRSQIVQVDDDLLAEIDRSRALVARLSDAIRNGEITVWAQPIVDVRPDGGFRVHSYECLARWNTPAGQRIPPSIFIPMVEEQGLTRELGEFVIEQAVKFVAALDDDARVSVNVSASHFVQPSFIPFVMRLIERYEIKPAQLTVELTESEDASPNENAPASARQLRQLGVGLSIDDFGTGFASLERLLNFPFTQLKFDKEIIGKASGTGLQHVLQGFGGMSAEAGLELVAEGVETHEQLALVASTGIQLAQGFLFGRPMPLDRVLRESRTRARVRPEFGPTFEPDWELDQI